MVAGSPFAKWCPCWAGIDLPFLLVHLLGPAANMLETGSSAMFYYPGVFVQERNTKIFHFLK
jgi:hypothetical protein